jgi:hypothetical protein
MAWMKSPRDKLLDTLFNSDPIEPKHSRPASLTGGFGGGFFDSESGNLFFADFDMFADYINGFYNSADEVGPWRLEELANTELSTAIDSPAFGRRYRVFYNQAHIGLVELHDALYDPRFDAEKDRRFWVNVQINLARLLPFPQVLGFLHLIVEPDAEGQRSVYLALLSVLWGANQGVRGQLKEDGDEGTISLFAQTSARSYLFWRRAPNRR